MPVINRTRVSLFLAIAVAIATPAALSAQNSWTHHLPANTVTASVAVGADFPAAGINALFGLSVYPGAEWTIADPKFGVVPVSFGAAARGRLGISGTFTAGVGAFATAHLGLLGLPIPEVFQALEWYL